MRNWVRRCCKSAKLKSVKSSASNFCRLTWRPSRRSLRSLPSLRSRQSRQSRQCRRLVRTCQRWYLWYRVPLASSWFRVRHWSSCTNICVVPMRGSKQKSKMNTLPNDLLAWTLACLDWRDFFLKHKLVCSRWATLVAVPWRRLNLFRIRLQLPWLSSY